jgi:hypothetical protein
MMSSQSRLLRGAVLAANASVVARASEGLQGCLLLRERLVKQPCYYGQVAALVVCGEQDGVLVLLLRNGSHLARWELVNE